MTQIKFRAWDVINKKMYPIAYPTWNGATEGKINFNDTTAELIDEDGDDKPILMQFTGILDKNGVEVFEGDMIVGTWNQTPIKGVVEFDEGMFGITDHDAYSLNRLVFEVVGNIYQN